MAVDTDIRIDGNSHQITNGTSSRHEPSYLSDYQHPSHGDSSPDCVRSKLEATSNLDPVVVCGLSIRLPGGIRNTEDFWDLLINGKDAQGPIRSDRYKFDSFGSALGKKGAINIEKGYFLDDDLASLDASFFSMSRDELEKSDPQQRQLLEVTSECLENACETDYRGKLVGCYVGTFSEDWLDMSAKETQHSGGYILTGHSDFILSNRVSYEYDLRGPRCVGGTSIYTISPACTDIESAWLSRPAAQLRLLPFTRRVEHCIAEIALGRLLLVRV